MFKIFERKKVDKNEEPDLILKDNSVVGIIINFIESIVFPIIYVCQGILVGIIHICIFEKVTIIINVLFIIFYVIWFIVLPLIYMKFYYKLYIFVNLLAHKLYFFIWTKRGNALTKKDLKKIKQVDHYTYMELVTQRCVGYCYTICFDICKTLQKGSIEFVALKNWGAEKEEFTIHVIYINNDWVFDTNCACQYPIERLDELYTAKTYKRVKFSEISSLSHGEFIAREYEELKMWAKANDCHLFYENYH